MKKKVDFSSYLLVRLLFCLPFGLYRSLVHLLLLLLFSFPNRLKSLVLSNLTLAFPEMSNAEKKQLCQRLFQEMALIFYEGGRLHHRHWVKEATSIEGLAHLQQALQEGRGVLAISAHFGNFPLLLSALTQRGYPVSTIIRDSSNPYLERYFKKIRQQAGIIQIPRHPAVASVRASLNWLHQGKILFILADQHSKHGVLAPLFDYEVGTPTGPAVIARRSGSPVLPVSIVRRGRRHHIRIAPPLTLSSSGKIADDLARHTALFNQIIEEWVTAEPDQWLSWFTRRFRGADNNPAEALSKKGK